MLTNKQHITAILAVSFCISAVLLIAGSHKNRPVFSQRVFHSVNGWGYDILVDGKLFIHQESIPGVKGTRGFSTKEQAEKTAQLIINKMTSGKEPTISTFEIGQVCQY